eukprot:scaffold10067_cov67-Phaeocystis_antarctica.AAC.8
MAHARLATSRVTARAGGQWPVRGPKDLPTRPHPRGRSAKRYRTFALARTMPSISPRNSARPRSLPMAV